MSNRLFRYADLMDEKYKIFVNAIKIRPERKQPHGRAPKIDPNETLPPLRKRTEEEIKKGLRDAKSAFIHIYNMLGEEMLKLERIANSEKAIDVSTWNAGVYFVEVETEKGIVRKKLVKQ